MPNYSNSIIAGLTKPSMFQSRKPTQVQGTSTFSGRPLPTQGTLQPTPSQDLYGFNDAMLDELDEREFNNARVAGLGGDDINVNIAKASVAPLAGLRKSYEAKQAVSPLTRQGQQIAEWEDFDREATSLGFLGEGMGERTLSPGQARNLYTREWNEHAATLPLRQEQARAGGLTEAARIKARGDLDVKNREAQMEADKYGQFGKIAEMFRAGGGEGQRNVSRFGLPGGFSMSFDDPDPVGDGGIPVRLLTDLTYQRYGVNAARNDREKQAAAGSYKQAQLNALSQARGIDPGLKEWVGALLVDPVTEDMDFDEIKELYLSQPPDPGEDPNDIPDDLAFEQARTLLRTLRGK